MDPAELRKLAAGRNKAGPTSTSGSGGATGARLRDKKHKPPPRARIDKINRTSVALTDAVDMNKALIEGGGAFKPAGIPEKEHIRREGSVVRKPGDYSQSALDNLFATADGATSASASASKVTVPTFGSALDNIGE